MSTDIHLIDGDALDIDISADPETGVIEFHDGRGHTFRITGRPVLHLTTTRCPDPEAHRVLTAKERKAVERAIAFLERSLGR